MRVELQAVTKRFGAVLANDRVDLTVEPGEVLALLGQNGAGKSTLAKILYGFYQADSGRILVDGTPIAMHSPRDAIATGIGMVFQQFSLIPALTVQENLALAHPRTPWLIGARARRVERARERLAQIAPHIDPGRRVVALSVGEVQLVEIAKVLNLDARLVILDEPSAVLTPAEAGRLWQLVRELATAGMSVVMITHKLADVAACAHRVAIMREGRLVASEAASECDPSRLVRLMMGDDVVQPPQPVSERDHALNRVWIKTIHARDSRGTLAGIDLRLAGGEILGVAGVSGNGQDLLADACTGAVPLEAGEVIVDGESVLTPRSRRAGRHRIGYIPEQPLVNAVAPDLSATVNLHLREVRALAWLPHLRRMAASARELMQRFDVRPPDPGLRVDALSGGNLQKLVAARELSREPPFVVACYPTMGLDLGAAAMVYQQLFALARAGSAVLWISEDLDDLLRYAHRIAVLFRGRIAGVTEAAAATREQIGAWMAGAGEPADAATAQHAAAAAATLAAERAGSIAAHPAAEKARG
jgi:simple sugar transport system ATP-binding protein